MTGPHLPSLSPRRTLWPATTIILVCLLAVGIPVGALILEENWRGARAWAICRRELSAKGETLDWKAFIPPPIPDDQNLAMTPLFVRELLYGIDPTTHAYTFGPVDERPKDLADLPFAGPRPSGGLSGGWEVTRHVDLPFYQRYYREKAGFPHGDAPQTPAEDVLLALTRYSPALDELAQAATQRPLTRFPVDWRLDNPAMTSLPHYHLQQGLAWTLALRASARLAAGHANDALRDLELGWRLSGDMSNEPVLIAYLVRMTCVVGSLNPVWEGLADRRWSAAELARLQADLQRMDFLTGLAATFRGERAYGLRGFDYVAEHRDLPANPFERALYALMPRGWFDLNKVISARCMQQYCIDALDPGAHRVSVARFEAGVSPPETRNLLVSDLLTLLPLSTSGSMGRRAAKTQTAVDEAVTACALERFFLDHQTYPARLDELVPGYLPRVLTDVIDGAPLRYHPTPDGRYQLYGIGWNQRDDGGQVAWNDYARPDDNQGDWVWQYTELPVSASKR